MINSQPPLTSSTRDTEFLRHFLCIHPSFISHFKPRLYLQSRHMRNTIPSIHFTVKTSRQPYLQIATKKETEIMSETVSPETKTCPDCMSEIHKDAKICPHCGWRVNSNSIKTGNYIIVLTLLIFAPLSLLLFGLWPTILVIIIGSLTGIALRNA